VINTKVTLIGEKELLKKLKRIPAKDAKKAIRKGTRAGAKMLVPEVKANTPKRTGLLKKSVKVRSLKKSRVRTGVAVQMGKGAFVGKTFYGGFAEYGTTRQDAQEFIKKSVRSKGQQATDHARDVINREIQSSSKR